MPRKTTSAFKTCPQLFSTFTTGEKTVQLGELQVKSNKDNLMRESPRETWDRSNKASSREGHVKDFPLLHWLPGHHSCRDCGLQVLTSAVELAGGRMEMGKLTCPQRTLPSEIQMVSGFWFFSVLKEHSLACYQPLAIFQSLKQLILVDFVQCSPWLYEWDNFQRSFLWCFHWLFFFCCEFWRLCRVAQTFTLAVVFLQGWKSVTNYVLASTVSTEKSAISLTVLALQLAWPFFVALSQIYFPFVLVAPSASSYLRCLGALLRSQWLGSLPAFCWQISEIINFLYRIEERHKAPKIPG